MWVGYHFCMICDPAISRRIVRIDSPKWSPSVEGVDSATRCFSSRRGQGLYPCANDSGEGPFGEAIAPVTPFRVVPHTTGRKVLSPVMPHANKCQQSHGGSSAPTLRSGAPPRRGWTQPLDASRHARGQGLNPCANDSGDGPVCDEDITLLPSSRPPVLIFRQSDFTAGGVQGFCSVEAWLYFPGISRRIVRTDPP